MGNIVWLASYPKSGNTWIRAFLANLIANRSDAGAAQRSCALLRGRGAARVLQRRRRASRAPSSRSTRSSRSARACTRSSPRMRAARASSRRTTTPARSTAIRCTTPTVTAGAIYVVRNPLDVAVSMTHHFGLTLDEAIERLGNEQVATANDAMFVTQILGSWSLHVKSWADLASERVLVLRYEDLLEKPGEAFREGRAARRHRAGSRAHRARGQACGLRHAVLARKEAWLHRSVGQGAAVLPRRPA